MAESARHFNTAPDGLGLPARFAGDQRAHDEFAEIYETAGRVLLRIDACDPSEHSDFMRLVELRPCAKREAIAAD